MHRELIKSGVQFSDEQEFIHDMCNLMLQACELMCDMNVMFNHEQLSMSDQDIRSQQLRVMISDVFAQSVKGK